MYSWTSTIPVEGRKESARARHLRLQLPHLPRIESHEVTDPVAPRSLDEGVHGVELIVPGRNHELAGAGVGDPVACAEFIERVPARDAHPRLQAAVRVVEAGVDDAGVARADFRADGVVALEDDHLAPAQGQGTRDREPDNAGAYHDAFNAIHRRDRFPYPSGEGV